MGTEMGTNGGHEGYVAIRKKESFVIPGLIIFTLTFGVSFLSAQASFAGLESWYSTLRKPTWTPPNWLFGPAWTVLYALMATAATLVWTSGRRRALILYAIQLALNGAWSVLFFGLRRPDWALADIVLLDIMVLVTLIVFYRIRPLAGLLLIPYLAWILYATALNWSIWSLNR